MLQDHTLRGKERLLKSHGFLVGIDAEERVEPEQLKLKLIDSLTWVEGVGPVEVEYLGEIPKYEEGEVPSVDQLLAEDFAHLASGGTE